MNATEKAQRVQLLATKFLEADQVLNNYYKNNQDDQCSKSVVYGSPEFDSVFEEISKVINNYWDARLELEDFCESKY